MQFGFDNHRLDTERRELLRGAMPVALQPQVFDVLVHLLRNRDRVVAKDDLIAQIWCGRSVSDSTFTSRINAARTAIGDDGKQQKLIRTVPRKGLRFVGDVVEYVGDQRDLPAPFHGHSALPDRPAIAVLPFNNMSADPEQDYFADGLSEDIITALSKLRWFPVIARNSSFLYRGAPVHIRQVAEELGVRYVLEGSVRKHGERVRITAQLNDATTGSHLWAEYYDRDLNDVFAVQDEITGAVVSAIEPQICLAEKLRSQRKPPASLDAWDLTMRALAHFWRLSRQDNADAQALLEQAINLEPGCGQAFGVLATCIMFGVHMGWASFKDAAPAAEQAALAAIRIDSEDAWAHAALGGCYFYSSLTEALAELELALRLNPHFSMAQGIYGLALCYFGRWRDAADITERALRRNPRDPFRALLYGVAAYAQFVGRHYRDAIALARQAIRLRAEFAGPYRVLAAAAGMAGRSDLAVWALQELRCVQPDLSPAWVTDALPWQLGADREHFVEGLRRAGLA